MSALLPELTGLCQITKEACDALVPVIRAFYTEINGQTAKKKSDASIFTIADGIVQNLLTEYLFSGGKFRAIVGEEDASVNILSLPYTVDDLTVPEEFAALVDAARNTIEQLNSRIEPTSYYQTLTIFIDPIDGTREFSTGLGEQCSFCIGFSNFEGIPVAGIVYRPLTATPTWAAGCASEGYTDGVLDRPAEVVSNGLLTSNGGISPFIVALMSELEFVRVPSGGAGNKMLMLLEGKGSAYIQDRGVSRWDTCAAQAVIEAYGGKLCKLTSFVEGQRLESYTYLTSETNLDFDAGRAMLTPYNATDKSAVKKGESVYPQDPAAFKAYSNICGLIAIDASTVGKLEQIHAGVLRAAATSAPAYD